MGRRATSAVNSIAPPPGSAPSLSTVEANAYIESFMGLLRNLIDFLSPSGAKRETDVVAEDFCDPGTWRPTLSQTLSAARIRVHKELAHLTTDRISGSPMPKQWDFNGLARELRPLLHDFTAKGLPARLSPRVKSAIK